MQRKGSKKTITISVVEESGRKYRYHMTGEGFEGIMRCWQILNNWSNYPTEERLVDSLEMGKRLSAIEGGCLE